MLRYSLSLIDILAPYIHLPGSICSETVSFGFSLEGPFSVAEFTSGMAVMKSVSSSEMVNDVQ